MKAFAIVFLVVSCTWVSVNAQCTSTVGRSVLAAGRTMNSTFYPFTATAWQTCVTDNTLNIAPGAENTKALGLLDAVETAVKLHSFTDLSKSYAQIFPRSFSIAVCFCYILQDISRLVCCLSGL